MVVVVKLFANDILKQSFNVNKLLNIFPSARQVSISCPATHQVRFLSAAQSLDYVAATHAPSQTSPDSLGISMCLTKSSYLNV